MKRQRIKCGYTSAEVAAQLEMTPGWWSQVENGKAATSGKTANRVCKLLESEFDEIFVIKDD